MFSNCKYQLIIIFLIIIPLGLAAAAGYPSLTQIKKFNAEIKQERHKLEELLSKGQVFQKNKKNFEMVKSNLDKIEPIWLKTGQELNFITDLEQIAAANQIEQEISLGLSQPTAKGNITAIPLALNINGELNNIINYINQIEMLDYYINFDAVDINNGGRKISRMPTKIAITDNNNPDQNQAFAEETLANQTILNVKLTGTTYWR